MTGFTLGLISRRGETFLDLGLPRRHAGMNLWKPRLRIVGFRFLRIPPWIEGGHDVILNPDTVPFGKEWNTEGKGNGGVTVSDASKK